MIEKGDIVIVKIKNIEKSSNVVYVEILNSDYTGFIKPGEVSSSWAKDIEKVVKVGSLDAAMVLDIDEKSKTIELSLKRVNKEQKSVAFQRYRNEQMSIKLIQIALSKSKSKKTLESILNKIYEDYGSAYNFLMNLNPKYIPKAAYNFLVEEINKRFKKEIKTTMKIIAYTYESDGVSRIKMLFDGLDVTYLGGGEYSIEIKAPDHKTANKIKEEIFNTLLKKAKELNIEINEN